MPRRPRRKSTWLIEERDDGSYDVTRGNRPVATGIRSAGHARDLVTRSRTDDERAYLVEPDGYRTELRF